MASRSGEVNVVRMDPDLVDLARTYLANRANDLKKIRGALERHDYAAIHRIGHNMHGSGQMFGFAELTALGADLQRAAGVRDAAEIARLERSIGDFVLRTRVAPDERAGAQAVATGAAPARASEAGALRGQYILVVDDDAMSRLLIKHYLEKAGYSVREGCSGEEALAVVKAEPRPALLVLDVVMPGADGLEVCRRIRSDPVTAAIPIVLLTALDRREDLRRGFEAGADDFVIKPVSQRELLSRVSKLASFNAQS